MTQFIQRAVWSFWSKPYRAHRKQIWYTDKHHWLAWVLSLETARQQYPETILVTDDEGARILVESIGLEFTSVSTELNRLAWQDPDWWVLGKLWAYRSQTKPFIHLDADVFLWKPLPKIIESASVFAQNPEYFIFGQHNETPWWYRPELFDARVKKTGGWLPPEWNWYFQNQRNLAFCTGIVGGTNVDFLNLYGDLALKIAQNPRNQAAFELMDNKVGDCLLIEQYFLAACLEYHQQKENSPFRDVTIRCLFDSPEEAYSSERATSLGYTHLIGSAKHNPKLANRLAQRVAKDYPLAYKRINNL